MALHNLRPTLATIIDEIINRIAYLAIVLQFETTITSGTFCSSETAAITPLRTRNVTYSEHQIPVFRYITLSIGVVYFIYHVRITDAHKEGVQNLIAICLNQDTHIPFNK